MNDLKDRYVFSEPALFLDLSGKILDMNRKAQDLFGCLCTSLDVCRLDTFFPHDAADINELLAQPDFVNNPVASQLGKHPIKTTSQNGEQLVVKISFLFLDADRVNDKKLVILIRDVTEEVHIQHEKKLFEEILNEALETIPDGFVIYDSYDRLFICNIAYLETYETSAPAIKRGATFEEIIRYGLVRGQYPQAGQTEAEQEKWLQGRLKSHRTPSDIVVQQTDNGRWLQIDERVTPSGLTVGIRTDITNLKNAEQKLLEHQAELERQKDELGKLADQYLSEKEKAEAASKAKSEFSAIISHELRTPLTGIMGITDLLLASDLSDEHRKYIEGLKSSSNNLLLLLNDILDYSKFEAEEVALSATRFDLYKLLEKMITALEPSAQEKGLTLRLDCEEKDQGLPVIGDDTRLYQIILNFVTNAIKFTDEGYVSVKLDRIREEIKYIRIRIQVADTGIGILPEHEEKLFKPFSQADSSTTRKYGGTGLGLAICKKLIEAMAGEIGFESAPGQGSVFWIELDLQKTVALDEENDSFHLNGLPSSNSIEGRKPLNLLLAEDNPVNRKVITTVLNKMGYNVETAENGEEAYLKVQTSEFDLVLMDMQMPEMDGCQATEKIRSLAAPKGTLPVIALTADVKAEQNQRYQNAGINAFLSKPVDWVQLEEVIKQFGKTGRGDRI